MFASVLGFINTMISSIDIYPQSYNTGHHELFVIYPGLDIDVVNPLDTKFSIWITHNFLEYSERALCFRLNMISSQVT